VGSVRLPGEKTLANRVIADAFLTIFIVKTNPPEEVPLRRQTL
jgi:hypothetical protein